MYKRGILILLVLISFSFTVYSLDTDFDGLPDEYELENGLDKLKSNVNQDSDSDGLLDFQEYKFNSSPVNIDTDKDGYTDKEEFDLGSNPRSKLSPKYMNILKIVVTILLGLLIVGIIIYLFSLIKPKKETHEDKKVSGAQKSETSSGKVEPQNNIKKKSEKKSFFKVFGVLSEFLLGPSISKARERDREKEQKEIRGVEDVYLDSSKVLKKLNLERDLEDDFITKKKDDNQVIFKPSDNNFDSELKRTLRNSKRKNNVSDILSYFDKEMDNEELTLLEEKKSKKEIFEWYQKRKEMKDKIIDLAKEEKEQLVTPKPVMKKEPTIFDKIDTGKEKEKKNVFDELDKINKKGNQ